jgi:SAM-dependent methyltransferase
MGTTALDYYDGPELEEEVREVLAATGLDPDHLDPDALGALDQFHAGGRPGSLALAELAGITAGDEVLDLGAGIGGPARLLASRLGARVTALDPTPRFCRLSEALVRATGLTGRVRVLEGGGDGTLPFADGSFDVVWFQALLPSIADKGALFGEAHRVLRPGGRLAFGDIASAGTEALEFPVPWGDGPSQSHLVSAADLRRVLEGAAFTARVWHTGLDATTGAARFAAEEPPAPEGLGLHVLLPDHDARMGGLGRNVVAGRIELVEAVLTRG